MSATTRSLHAFVDFRGWRFRAPFRCFCCGRRISMHQFCFARACGSCDCGHCNHNRDHRRVYSGHRQVINANDPSFIPEDVWLNPPSGLEWHVMDAEFIKVMQLAKRFVESSGGKLWPEDEPDRIL